VFRGSKEYTPAQIQDMLGIGAPKNLPNQPPNQQPRPAGAHRYGHNYLKTRIRPHIR
jgi:hypothetical protein